MEGNSGAAGGVVPVGENAATLSGGARGKPGKQFVQAIGGCSPSSLAPLAWDAAERPYCFAAFHLGRRFQTFKASAGFSAGLGVLVDDDGEDDEVTMSAPPRIAGVLEVIGDGRVLWRKDKAVPPGDTFGLEVNVLDVDVLVLRASSAHADLGVNAVFVEPELKVCDDWTCAGWRNDRF